MADNEERLGNRFEDDRRFDLRETNIREMFRMQYQHPLHIDPSAIPPNMEYKWVRDTVFGDPGLSNLNKERRLMWTPVPMQNHPEMMPPLDINRKHHLDGYIHYNGLVLCQRPKQIGDIQRKIENEVCIANMQAIPGTQTGDVQLHVHKHEVGVTSMQSFKD